MKRKEESRCFSRRLLSTKQHNGAFPPGRRIPAVPRTIPTACAQTNAPQQDKNAGAEPKVSWCNISHGAPSTMQLHSRSNATDSQHQPRIGRGERLTKPRRRENMSLRKPAHCTALSPGSTLLL